MQQHVRLLRCRCLGIQMTRSIRPYRAHCENVTSSTQPEVHNVSYRNAVEGEPSHRHRQHAHKICIGWSWTVWFLKYGSGQTDRQTDILITIKRTTRSRSLSSVTNKHSDYKFTHSHTEQQAATQKSIVQKNEMNELTTDIILISTDVRLHETKISSFIAEGPRKVEIFLTAAQLYEKSSLKRLAIDHPEDHTRHRKCRFIL